jgi:aspartyl-tRNA(Asn)/glutamyl-tRNA(Gln) amidotransferase subunit A
MSDPLSSDAGVASIAAAVRGGEASALAVTEAALARIAAHDPAISAFLAIDGDGARAAAAQLDAGLAAGTVARESPLLGVPVALKDNVCVAGGVTTAGSRILEGWRAPYDATIVTRLRAAGAVVLGKTNLDEFGMGSSTEFSAYGITRNPWDPSRVPGGSSGGSAAAVASGMAPLAIGSDTGGSIRQPAAFCGVAGFKPSYGRVSRFGLVAYASSLDQLGPLARSVEDLALAYRAIAGHDPQDATSSGEPLALPTGSGVAGLRVGIHRDFLAALPHAATRAAIEAAIAHLVEDGARVVNLDDVDLLTREALAVYYLLASAEASSNLSRFDGMRYGPREAAEHDGLEAAYGATRAKRFGAEVKRRILLGTFALSAGYHDAYYVRAQAARRLLRAAFERAFERADVLIGAVAPEPAFPLGARTEDPLTMYLGDSLTIPPSLAGLPALALPCGMDGGLPLALQVIGRPFDDARVLDVATAIERRTGLAHRVAPPAGFGGAR